MNTSSSDQSPLSSPTTITTAGTSSSSSASSDRPSRYESQKRRDWNTFGQYLCNHRPPLSLSRCSGAHVLEFLRYLDQFGKTKVHSLGCPFFGHPHPPAPCSCPLRQAWGSLDALVGRLRAAFEENGGQPEANPFGARAVRLYLREIRDSQAKARGIAYEKKKRKKPTCRSSCISATADAANDPRAAAHEGEDGGNNVVTLVNYGGHHLPYHHQGQFGNLVMGDEVVMAAMVEAHNSGCRSGVHTAVGVLVNE